MQKQESAVREDGMEAGNSPGEGVVLQINAVAKTLKRREHLDTPDRYEMEWTSLARAATYGCAGCTLRNSLHPNTNLFVTDISQQMAVECLEEGCLLYKGALWASSSPGVREVVGSEKAAVPKGGASVK